MSLRARDHQDFGVPASGLQHQDICSQTLMGNHQGRSTCSSTLSFPYPWLSFKLKTTCLVLVEVLLVALAGSLVAPRIRGLGYQDTTATGAPGRDVAKPFFADENQFSTSISIQVFPSALGDPAHSPFFSVENASTWITSHGYQLYLQHNDSDEPASLWDPDKATVVQIRAYRNYAYMNTVYGPFDDYRTQNSTPFSSRPPSRAGSSASSRAPSRGDSGFSAAGSRPSSRASFVPESCAPSSSPFNSSVIVISDSDSDNFPATVSAASIVPKIEPGSASPLSIHPTGSSHRIGRNGKEKAATSKIQLTRQEAVDEIIQISTIPSTWTVPRIPAAYLVDLSNTLHSLKVGNRTSTIDRFIRTEVNLKTQDQDSWGGSSGHLVGDSDAAGFLPDLTMAIKCRRAHLKCKGVYTCEFIDPTLFAGCKRYEPDPAATQALWKHELDANEREAASVPGIISRGGGQTRLLIRDEHRHTFGGTIKISLTHASYSPYGFNSANRPHFSFQTRL
ncbi:hypothetical protein B0H14DRAFT_2593548 [Mycena olivaceomarginata]|nr:hypothetical protein B0H14DRAFT_2593548 [Mycena olivaceomarginata]